MYFAATTNLSVSLDRRLLVHIVKPVAQLRFRMPRVKATMQVTSLHPVWFHHLLAGDNVHSEKNSLLVGDFALLLWAED